jgi:hypothetical protein
MRERSQCKCLSDLHEVIVDSVGRIERRVDKDQQTHQEYATTEHGHASPTP